MITYKYLYTLIVRQIFANRNLPSATTIGMHYSTRREVTLKKVNVVQDHKERERFSKIIQDRLLDHRVTIVASQGDMMASAAQLLIKDVNTEVTMMDCDLSIIQDESDKHQGQLFSTEDTYLQLSDVHALRRNVDLCILAAGVQGQPHESPVQLAQRNVQFFKKIIPQLLQRKPNSTLLIATNPVDLMTYAAWRLSGLPSRRVVGSGTAFDSARLRLSVAQRLGVATSSVHAWVIGEHGDTCVPVWSGATVDGKLLKDIIPNLGTEEDLQEWDRLHEEATENSTDIRHMKDYAAWSVGYSLAIIARGILSNRNVTVPLTTMVKGHHGIDKEVFTSLPCVINKTGVAEIIKLELSETEETSFRESTEMLYEMQKQLIL